MLQLYTAYISYALCGVQLNYVYIYTWINSTNLTAGTEFQLAFPPHELFIDLQQKKEHERFTSS